MFQSLLLRNFAYKVPTKRQEISSCKVTLLTEITRSTLHVVVVSSTSH